MDFCYFSYDYTSYEKTKYGVRQSQKIELDTVVNQFIVVNFFKSIEIFKERMSTARLSDASSAPSESNERKLFFFVCLDWKKVRFVRAGSIEPRKNLI